MKETEFKVGDHVFVIDWGKQYSEFDIWKDSVKISLFNWKTELPSYCGTDHHWTFIYEPNLTLKGTVNKRDPKKLKEKIPSFKNYKYEIVEIGYHYKAGEYHYDDIEQRKRWGDSKYSSEPVYLLASTHTDKAWRKCYVQIPAEGISFLTPEQFADKEFNALKEFHKNRWIPGQVGNKFPEELMKVIYDKNDNVLFGSHYVKGKVTYHYVPGEYMTTGNPFITHSSISYDGVGNKDIPKDAILMHFNELPKMFPDNTFR